MDYEKEKINKIVNEALEKYRDQITADSEPTGWGFDRIVYNVPSTRLISRIRGEIMDKLAHTSLYPHWTAIIYPLGKANPARWRLEVTTQFKDGAPELINNLLYFKIQGASQ